MNRNRKKAIFGVLGIGVLCMWILSSIIFADLAGPVIRWIGPAENMCLTVSSADPNIGVAVEAEDEDGIKQGIVWLAHGHYDRGIAGATWSRIWGATFVRDGVAPPAASTHFLLRMMGRPEGEYTLKTLFNDYGPANGGTLSYRHFFYDANPPTLAITNVTDGKIICKDFDFRVQITASDTGCGMDRVILYLFKPGKAGPRLRDRLTRAIFQQTVRTPPYNITIPPEKFTEEEHTITVVAIDKAGKRTTLTRTIRPIRICKIMQQRRFPQ